jgi:hypothetical protein
MNDSSSNPPPSPLYPKLPDPDDPRWQQAVVRARHKRSTELRTLPHHRLSSALLTVHAGDSVSIISEIRSGAWIMAKVGYKVGWLNTDDVDFATTQSMSGASGQTFTARPRDPQPTTEKQTEPLEEPTPATEKQTEPLEEPTAPAPTTEKQTEPLSPPPADEDEEPETPTGKYDDQIDEPITEKNLKPLASKPPPSAPAPPPAQPEPPEPARQPARSPGVETDDDQTEVRLTVNEINRIIRYLKGISDTLKEARDRTRREHSE